MLSSLYVLSFQIFHKALEFVLNPDKQVLFLIGNLHRIIGLELNVLNLGLIQLLKTKSLSNITITELTERAGVSRMTYYRNYHSLDEIFSSYLKDLVESYRQDVATWPDKGNYNDSRNMLHCYEYFNHYKEFIACLVQTGLGHLLLQALDSYILDTYYTEDKGQDFYYTLRAFSGSLYNIYVTWILEDSKESAEEIVSIICKIYS